MNIRRVSMLPTPKTTFLRDEARFGHFTHASARSRSSAKAAAFSAGGSLAATGLSAMTGAGAGAATLAGVGDKTVAGRAAGAGGADIDRG